MTTAYSKPRPTIDLYYDESTWKNDYSEFEAMERGDPKWDVIHFAVAPNSTLTYLIQFLKVNGKGHCYVNLFHSRNSNRKVELFINYWDSKPYPKTMDNPMPPETVLVKLQLRKENK